MFFWFFLGFISSIYLNLVLFLVFYDTILYVLGRSDHKPNLKKSFKFWKYRHDYN